MNKTFFIILFLGLFAWPVFSLQAVSMAEELSGKILLQVEDNGEAWYVDTSDQKRYFLGRPEDAFKIMRERGVGISNSDLALIEASVKKPGVDDDEDGLDDVFEEAWGTKPYEFDTDHDGFADGEELEQNFNPLGNGKLYYNQDFARKHAGKIFLQVESKGEAWYVNPGDLKRYFLGRPADAFQVMRELGLGISNENLQKIETADFFSNYTELEKVIFDAINSEREKAELSALRWNNELSRVARIHSADLAQENEKFTGQDRTCDYPLIHHENLSNGAYNGDRLKNQGIHYYSQAGENIALISTARYQITYEEGNPIGAEIDNCPVEREGLDSAFRSSLEKLEEEEDKFQLIRDELVKREKLYQEKTLTEKFDVTFFDNDYLSSESVLGWMNSPGHKENILHEDYDETGVGAVVARGYLFVTQTFIKRAECGFFGGACCEKEGYYPYCFVPLTCQNNICVQ